MVRSRTMVLSQGDAPPLSRRNLIAKRPPPAKQEASKQQSKVQSSEAAREDPRQQVARVDRENSSHDSCKPAPAHKRNRDAGVDNIEANKATETLGAAVREGNVDLCARVNSIYQHFKRCSGGADGGVVGMNGSVRATCLVRALQALRVQGKELVDFGAGDGRVLLAAIASGASKAAGYELPDNSAHQFVFDAVVEAISAQSA